MALVLPRVLKDCFQNSMYHKCWYLIKWNKCFYSRSKLFFLSKYSYKILFFFIPMEIFFWENHLSCLGNSESSWLAFGTLKLNSGSIRLLCLSPQRIFRIENPWLPVHSLNTLGLRTHAARKSNIWQWKKKKKKGMTIHVCVSSNPKGGRKHSYKPNIKPTLKGTFKKQNKIKTQTYKTTLCA